MTKVYDTAYFIERANKVHGLGVYDYSKSEYVNAKTKVVITCLIHGDFLQAVGNHLEGKGCKACSVQRVKNAKGNNTESLIAKGRERHGYRYDYSKTIYKSSRIKSIFICRVHGEFRQTPEAHLNTNGCQKCVNKTLAEKAKKTTAQFISEAELIHKGAYDYSLCDVDGVFTKVAITCRVHGVFMQTPDSHLRGRGCPECGKTTISRKQMKRFSDFEREANKRHGSRYRYFSDSYISGSFHTDIECLIHGKFRQNAGKHLAGDGCPECGKGLIGHGRSKFVASCKRNNNGNGTLYVLKCTDVDEVFYKIGITSRTVKARYSSRPIPFSFTEVYLLELAGRVAFDLETRLHDLLREYKHVPSIHFEGHTECFTTIKPIEQLLEKLSSTEQLQLLA